MSSIGGGSGGIGASGGVSPAEIARLICDAGSSADATDLLDLSNFNRQQIQQLQESLVAAGETLSDEEKADFERGEPERIKTILKRIRLRRVEKQQAVERQQATPAPGQTGDGLTASHIPLPRPEAPSPIPLKELASAAEVFHLIYAAPGHADATLLDDLERWGKAQLQDLANGLLDRGERLTDAQRRSLRSGDPKAIKKLLLTILERRLHADQTFIGDQRQSRVAGFGLLKRGQPITDKKTLEKVRRELFDLISAPPSARKGPAAATDKLLGKATKTVDFKDGFPAGGRSGEAHTLPAIQVLSGDYQRTARGLGVQTLVDLLVRLITPAPRLRCARMLGLPTTTLLLAAHRAELLDLPINPARGKPPHLKDIILLARLGLNTVRGYAQLGQFFHDQPAKLELLAALIAAWQKGVPATIGRERLTRHDIREWLMAAGRRGSDVAVPEAPSAGQSEVEHAAERILSWYLLHRFDHPESSWLEMIARLLIAMRAAGLAIEDAHWKRLLIECGKEKVVSLMQLTERHATELDRERRELERQRYAAYGAGDDDDLSIFTELSPLVGPDADREDRLICFWMDPVADFRHVVRTDGGGLPESLQAVYVCMDPDSGAIIPFGG